MHYCSIHEKVCTYLLCLFNLLLLLRLAGLPFSLHVGDPSGPFSPNMAGDIQPLDHLVRLQYSRGYVAIRTLGLIW